MEITQDCNLLETALENAAKIICTMKCGLCPIREDNFSGCPFICDEEIRPWKCWVVHLREISTEPSSQRS